jgi:hypothetical protein
MKRPDRFQVVLALLGVAAAVILLALLSNLRSPQPLRYRLDFDDRGPELLTVTIYDLAPDSLALVPLEREVMAGSARRDVVRDLVAYLAEPSGDGRAPLPPGTHLLHYFEGEDGEATLDLSAEIQSVPGDGGILEERLRLTALVRTLSENLDGVKRVRLLALGQPLERWGEHLTLGPSVDVNL